MGQQLGGTTSATEVEQTQIGSYAQTEMHFVEHSDHLMPRVHQMRTDLAQHYHSSQSSIRLQTSISEDERANFEINGEDLMLRDINVYCTTKSNHREILEKMKMMAMQNNTMGASVYDLGKLMQTDSIGSLNSILKEAENKQKKEKQEQMQHEQEMNDKQIAQANKEKQMELSHESTEAEKERRKDVLVAEIKASGFGAMQDMNENNQSDFIDNMTKLKQTDQYQETIGIQRDKVSQNNMQHADKMMIKRDEMNLKRELKDKDVAIAKENKNQYDFKKPEKKETKKKK